MALPSTESRQFVVSRAAGLCLVLLGIVVTSLGYQVLGRWSLIGSALAACGVLWAVAGPFMAASGLTLLASLGRRRFPLWTGGSAAVLAGLVWVAGVLASVIPCSGPT